MPAKAHTEDFLPLENALERAIGVISLTSSLARKSTIT